MFKKIRLLMAIFVLLIVVGVTAQASGYKLGEAVYTDASVYINNFPVKSYCFNGQLLVLAEDMYDFGFDVTWNEYTKSINIKRNPFKNKVTYAAMVFKPTENAWGCKSIDITTTPVKVYSGNYRLTSYGGVDGYTLINVEDLACIDGVYTSWNEYGRILNVKITDGLEYGDFYALKELDPFMEIHTSCSLPWGVTVDYEHKYVPNADALVLSFTQYDEYGTYCVCPDFEVTITDVIDANGNSRKKKYHYGDIASTSGIMDELGYYYGFTDYELSSCIVLDTDSLAPNTAVDRYGWIEFDTWCSCYGWYSDSMYVDVLPLCYETTDF